MFLSRTYESFDEGARYWVPAERCRGLCRTCVSIDAARGSGISSSDVQMDL